MQLDEIKKQWVNSDMNPQKDIALWDSQADDPTYHRIPTFEDNAFLQLLEREHMLDASYDVLDVGCGVGVYALALSKRVHSAVGIDLSPKMLEHGRTLLEREDRKNVTLTLTDWNLVDLGEQGLRERFDLVFTHTSPAVSDAASLEKLMGASRRFCAVCNPIRMAEPVLEEVCRIAGLGEEEAYCGSGLIYMLDMLLQMGYQPKLEYENQIWPMHQTYEDACTYYLGRAGAVGQIAAEKAEAVKAYLASIAKEGMVSDRIDAKIITVYWEK